ncbi:MAG: hypothetical protein WCD31_10485, partial [Gillisia sp.]
VIDEDIERKDEEYSNERKNLVEERRRLRHERLKLEEERKKLEAERKKHSPTSSLDDEDARQRRKNATGDPFYDRDEFDGKNYREI